MNTDKFKDKIDRHDPKLWDDISWASENKWQPEYITQRLTDAQDFLEEAISASPWHFRLRMFLVGMWNRVKEG